MRFTDDQKRPLAELERHEQKLIYAYLADALPIEELRPRQHRVGTDRDRRGRRPRSSRHHRASDRPVEAVTGCKEGTPEELSLPEGSNLNQLAGQLTEGWTLSVWSRVARLLADGPPAAAAARPTAPAARVRQRQRRLSPDEVTQLLADYQAGLTVAAAAAKYRVNVHTATKHLTDHGIAIRQKLVVLPASEHTTLLELKTTGWSNARIAQRYGCSRQAVQQALKRARQINS